jgi:hypothetical protein
MFDPLPDFPKARSKNWANVIVKTISTPSRDGANELYSIVALSFPIPFVLSLVL